MATATIRIINPPREMGSSPIMSLCARGNFPESFPHGLEANWSACSFVSISQIAAVAEVQSAVQSHGGSCSCRPSAFIDQYISRMDYYRLLGINHPEGFKRHAAEDRFLPLSPIGESGANEVAAQLRATVTSHLAFSSSAIDMIDWAFGEVLDNVLQHSRTSVPGLVCSQYYRMGNYVEVCVVDCGCGIPVSMGRNPSYAGLDGDALLARAFERETGEFYGNSDYGTSRVSGGMGLWATANIIRALDGRIWSVSLGHAVEVSPTGTSALPGMYYPGTIICMRFPVTDKEITGDAVLRNGELSPVRWSPSDSWSYEGNDDDVLW